jgi:glycosyltransferase involved in cell wall biosynthesis
VSNFLRRRVVICAPGFPASRNDSDKPFLLNHALALVSAGFDVRVVCPSIPGLPNRQLVEGIEVVRARYAPRRWETLASSGSMYREARGFRSVLVVPMILALVVAAIRESHKANLVAFHGHWWLPGGLVAVVAGRLVRTQSVVHLHGSDSIIVSNFAMRWFFRVIMRRATHRLAVSAVLAAWGENVSARSVEVCPMPISEHFSTSVFAPPPEGPVLGVGRLVREKGFDVLLEAVGRMNQLQRKNVVIIGKGPEYSSLVSQALSLNVNLQILGPFAPSEVAEWYLKSSMVVVPSRREGFGLVAAEAAASGRAVIGTRVGGLPQIIEDGVSGLLVEPENIDELFRALTRIDISWGLSAPKQVRQLSRENHSTFLKEMYDRKRT